MDLLTFTVLGLATWRLSRMLVREDGPFHAFFKLRELVGITHDQDGEIVMIPNRVLPLLLSCVWCSSVWVAAFWMALWLILPAAAAALASVFALSTLAIIVDRHFIGN